MGKKKKSNLEPTRFFFFGGWGGEMIGLCKKKGKLLFRP